MHGDRDVGEHRLRTRRRNLDAAIGIVLIERIADAPQRAVALDVLELGVGNRGLRGRIPVDQTRSAVDQAVAIKGDEDAPYRRRERVVHREARALPIRPEAETAKLFEDLAAVRPRPLPGTLDERFAAEVLAAQAFLGELSHQHCLGGDRRVIDARQPVRIIPEHPVVARQHVHRCVGRAVPQMRARRYVRGRHADDKRRPCGIRVLVKVTVALPVRVQARFGRLRIVLLGEVHRWACVQHRRRRRLSRIRQAAVRG